MNGIRGYLVAVVAVCMICVLALQMVQKESMRKLVRFVGGMLILLVVATPLLSFDMEDLAGFLEDASSRLDIDTSMIGETAENALAEHIKKTTETYIEQKANELGATVQAKVVLTEEEYPVPYSVEIIGSLTPAQQKELSLYMSRDLGIDVLRQEWTLYG